MESVAYGLNLLPSDFWNLTFHEFFLIQKGRNDVIEMKERFEWERTRWLACVLLQPHTKKNSRLTPQKLVKFEWEKTEVEDKDKQRKRAEYIAKKYKLLKDERKES